MSTTFPNPPVQAGRRSIRLWLVLVLVPWAAGSLATASPSHGSTVLSTAGSGRATAYWEQNKIVTCADRTHVVWLDADESGFWVRGRTLDRLTGRWSETVTIGEGQDNHGGPGLTLDSQGYLHILYYPHHGQFRYRRSVRPNDLSEWTPEIRFGEELSFPTLVCAADDTLILTARRGYHGAGGKHLPGTRMEQELWKKPVGGDWRRTATLLRSREPGYAQFAVALAWGPDRETLHLSCRIFEGNPRFVKKPINTVAYMKSGDGGETWTKADGTTIALPATADSIDVLADDGGAAGPRLNSAPLAVDAAGTPHLVYNVNVAGTSRLYHATPAAGLGWTRRDLTPYLPDAIRGWEINLGMGGGMTFSDSGRVTIVAAVLNPPLEDRTLLKEWGHPSTEIVRLWSDDGGRTFQSEMLSTVDPNRTHWLVNIERPTGHNRVPQVPGVIYTAGGAGTGLMDLDLHNEVIWSPKK